MSLQAMSAVLVLPPTLLTVAQRFVLLMYANHANAYGQHSYPGHATIAEETGLSESTVFRATKELVKLGLLQVVAYPGRDPKTQQFTGSVVYDLALPGLKAPNEKQLPLQEQPGNGAASHSDYRPGGQAGSQTDQQAGSQTGSHSAGVTVEPATAETVAGIQLFEAKNEDLVGRLRAQGYVI